MYLRKAISALASGLLCTLGLSMTVATTHAQTSTYSSGAGASLFKWSVNSNGDIFQLQSPSGFEHIDNGTVIEGYLLADNGFTDGYDAFVAGAGFSAPVVTQPGGVNTFPLTITRDTGSLSGSFHLRLTQKYSQDTAKHTILITMMVTNLESFNINNIDLTRYVDFDIDNGFNNFFGRTAGAMYASNDTPGHGVLLEALTPTVPDDTTVQTFVNFDNSLSANTVASESTPTAAGDFSGRVKYHLGTINSLKSKTVVFGYKRY